MPSPEPNTFRALMAEIVNKWSWISPGERIVLRQKVEADIARDRAKECPTCGGLRAVYPRVPLGQEDYGRVIPCPDCVKWEAQLEARRKAEALSPFAQVIMTFENFQQVPGAIDAYKTALALGDGTADYLWGLIYGGRGNGKTHLLKAACKRMAGRGIKAAYWDVRQLFGEMRRRVSTGGLEDFLDELAEVPLLALDELGAQKETDFTVERLEDLINRRYEPPAALLVATNLDWTALPEPIKSRFSDKKLARVVLNTALDFRPQRR